MSMHVHVFNQKSDVCINAKQNVRASEVDVQVMDVYMLVYRTPCTGLALAVQDYVADGDQRQ